MGSNPTIPTEERKYESPGSETHRLPCGGKVVGPFHSPLRRSLISRRAFPVRSPSPRKVSLDNQSVAQLGSVPAWGAGSRGFKSHHSD